MISTTEGELWSNRGNALLEAVLRSRYPGLATPEALEQLAGVLYYPGALEAAGGQGHLPAPTGGLTAPASEAGRRVSDGRLGLSQLSRGRQNKVMICRNKLLPSHLVGRLKNIIIIFANLNFLTCYI